MSGLAKFLEVEGAVVEVRIAEVRGSSPREPGAFMLVRGTQIWGTVGGGQLEYMAMDEARMLARSGERFREMNVPLGPEIGQCCGGRVRLMLKELDDKGKAELIAEEAKRLMGLPEVLILGAGHVGRALAYAFAPLPVRAKLIDSRAESWPARRTGRRKFARRCQRPSCVRRVRVRPILWPRMSTVSTFCSHKKHWRAPMRHMLE
jgi:xanthine dehydrogenase accessory factor